MNVIGDEVIYIGTNERLVRYLTKLKSYKLLDGSNFKYYRVKNNTGQIRRYNASYFSTLQEFRDKQINQIIYE